jgi:hypothetical protein
VWGGVTRRGVTRRKGSTLATRRNILYFGGTDRSVSHVISSTNFANRCCRSERCSVDGTNVCKGGNSIRESERCILFFFFIFFPLLLFLLLLLLLLLLLRLLRLILILRNLPYRGQRLRTAARKE